MRVQSRGPAWVEEAGGPPELLAMLRQGRPIVVTSRESPQSGRRAEELLRNDAQEAFVELEARLRCELPDIVPTREQLREAFRSTKVIRSRTRDGSTFTHRVVVIDRSRDLGLVLVLVLGSGTKLDADRNSPAARIAADMIADYGAALAWAKRLDRFLRHHWAAAPIMIELDQQGAWIGDGKHGIRKPEGPQELLIFWEFSAAHEEADKMPGETRRGMRIRTEPRMVDGIVMVGSGRPPPPGIARVKLRDGTRLGRTCWVLDTPAALDSLADQVAVGMPQTLDIHGQPADQVANVRFALSKVGRPEWPFRRIALELEDRGWSTDRLRQLEGDDAVMRMRHKIQGGASGQQLLRSVLQHLDVYESGAMELQFGLGTHKRISGLMPLDGPWASKKDFERIRSRRSRIRALYNARTSSTFSGVACVVDGVPSVLITGTKQQHVRGQRVYSAARADLYPQETCRSRRGFLVPREELGELVAGAIARAGTDALMLLPVEDEDAATTGLRAQVAEHERRIGEAVARRDAIRAEMSGQHGYTPTGALKQQLNHDYNEQQAKVTEAEQRMLLCERELEQTRRETRASHGGARAHDLLRLVDSLRDPTELSFRPVWQESIRDLAFETKRVQVGGLRGLDVHVTGRLVLVEGDEEYSVPIDGWIRSEAHLRAQARAEDAIRAMRDGVPVAASGVPSWWQLRPLLAELFGAARDRCPLTSCEDPRILRLVAPLLLDGADPCDVAEESGEPLALVQRVARMYRPPMFNITWLQTRSQTMDTAYALAASNDGIARWRDLEAAGISREVVADAIRRNARDEWATVRSTGLRLEAACHSCGGLARAAFRNPEPASRICLDCRMDEARVVWPAESYDTYLAYPDLWASYKRDAARGRRQEGRR